MVILRAELLKWKRSWVVWAALLAAAAAPALNGLIFWSTKRLRAAAGHQIRAQGREPAGRVVVRAVAQHDVQEDHRQGGVPGLLPEQLEPGRRVDHRVRHAAGVLLRAEVELIQRRWLTHLVADPFTPASV